MFDFFKSNKKKREEQISEYIDQRMSAAERQGFETLLGQDADLREQVEAQQEVKSLLSQMPKLKAPRNFVLDPAVYGGKAPAPSFIELLYPKMRLATAAASFLFVIVLGAGLLLGGPLEAPQAAPAADVAAIPAPTEVQNAERNSAAVEVEQTIVVQTELDQAASDEAAGARLMVEEKPKAMMGAAEVADDAGMAEADAEIAIESPRLEEAIVIEGERVIDTTPLPAAEPDQTEDNSVATKLEVEAAPANPALNSEWVARSTQGDVQTSNWLPSILWALGALTVLLIAATFIIGRRVD